IVPIDLKGKKIKVRYTVTLRRGVKVISFYFNDPVKKINPQMNNLLLTANLKGIGISLISTNTSIKHEILYLCLSSAWVAFIDELDYKMLQVRIQDIKIDNNIL